jgi:hypothetical protein
MIEGAINDGSADGTASAASFWIPLTLVVNPSWTIYVTDSKQVRSSFRSGAPSRRRAP